MATLCFALQYEGSYSPSVTSLFSFSTSLRVSEVSKDSFEAPTEDERFGKLGTIDKVWKDIFSIYVDQTNLQLSGKLRNQTGSLTGMETLLAAMLYHFGVKKH